MATRLLLYSPTHAAATVKAGGSVTSFAPTQRYDWLAADCQLQSGMTVTVQTGCNVFEVEVPGAGETYAIYQGEVIRVENYAQTVLLITDLDDTLICEREDGKAAMRRFFRYWIRRFLFNGSKLVYNTGRTLYRYKKAFEEEHEGIILPDMAITGIGGEVYEIDSSSGSYMRLEDFYKPEMFENWDSESVGEILLERYPYLIKKPYPGEDCPLSLLREITPSDSDAHFTEIHEYFANSSGEIRYGKVLKVRAILSGVRTSNLFIDFLPQKGGKRLGVEFVQGRLGFPVERTFIAGDSGNDVDSFEGPEVGVLPANSHQELRDWVHRSPWGANKYESALTYADAITEMLEKAIAHIH